MSEHNTTQPYCLNAGGGTLGAVCDPLTGGQKPQILAGTTVDGGFLEPGTKYYVRVRAQNEVGVGDYTVTTPVSLVPRSPPTPPTDVTVRSVVDSATSLVVNWKPPADFNG